VYKERGLIAIRASNGQGVQLRFYLFLLLLLSLLSLGGYHLISRLPKDGNIPAADLCSLRSQFSPYTGELVTE
jgi:hypothetical protein